MYKTIMWQYCRYIDRSALSPKFIIALLCICPVWSEWLLQNSNFRIENLSTFNTKLHDNWVEHHPFAIHYLVVTVPATSSIARRGDKCTVECAERNFVLCNRPFGDMWFLAKGKIMKMIGAEMINDEIVVKCFALLGEHRDFFTYPFESSKINILVNRGFVI